jgi:hypothetical protein
MYTEIRATRLRLVLLGLVTAIAVAACGGSGGSSNGSSGAQSLLSQTFASGHTVNSGVLGFSVSIGAAGSASITGPLALNLSGPFQSRGAGKLPSSDFTIVIGALGQHASLGVISTGTAGYVTLQGNSYQLPASDFTRLESSFSSVTSTSGGQSSTLAKLGIKPQTWLRNPTVIGTENVGGTATTHIHASVDVAALTADLNKLLAKASSGSGAVAKLPSSISAATEAKIASAAKTASVDVWTGQSDKTLRKMAITLTVPVSGSLASLVGGATSATITVTLQYSDLNQPQTITAPTKLLPYSQFAAKLAGVSATLGATLGQKSGSGSSTSNGTQTLTAPSPVAPTPSTTSMQKYTACLRSADNDVAKMQKCAGLLNGSAG